MIECIYLDQKGKTIEVDDLIHYASKGTINSAWVQELLPNKGGVKIMGKGNKREAVIKNSDKQIIVVSKGYYKTRKKAQRTRKA